MTGAPALRSLEDRRAVPLAAEPRRINVLLLVESMEVAGAEKVVLSLARGLDRGRFRPLVGCLTSEGPLAEALRQVGVPVFALGKRRGFDLGVVRRLIRLLREQRVDVVHTHVWNADVWGRFSALLARVPVRMMTAHNVDDWKTPPQLAVDWALAKVSAQVVCVSEAVKEFYRTRAGVSPRKLSVILNGIDLAPFNDVSTDAGSKRRELGVPVDAPVCSVIARLVPQKGHRYLLAALPAIREAFPSAVVLVVGNGSERESLERQAHELGLLGDAVRFLGERRDIPEILKATDVLVLPSSEREGLPICVLEAMAARRPVVVTDLGGNRQVIEEGRTGFIVPAADAGALAAGIRRMLEDPEQARAMGEAGRAKVEREFGVSRMVQQTADLYESLLAQVVG